mgnify:CR=1 FL=1
MEKTYNLMKVSGVASIVIGIIMIIVGVATGIISIVSGAKLLIGKNDIEF